MRTASTYDVLKCKPRSEAESDKAKRDAKAFYTDETGRCTCPISGREYGDEVDMAHMDDENVHSYLHNLIPLHKSYNRPYGPVMQKYGSPAMPPIERRYVQLRWDKLLAKAEEHKDLWRYRRAYACTRAAYYFYTRYFEPTLSTHYEIMAQCLYFVRHVWNDDLIWGLLDHDLVPLLTQPSSTLHRTQVSPIVRQLAAIWTDIRDVPHTDALLAVHEEVLPTRRLLREVDEHTACSFIRRQGLGALAHEGKAWLDEGIAFGAESLKLAKTVEQRVNALEIEAWGAEVNGDWNRARRIHEERLIPEVLPGLERFLQHLKHREERDQLGRAPLMIPEDISLLNVAQAPIGCAVAILKTGGRSKKEMRQVVDYVAMGKKVHALGDTRPFMLTDRVRTAYQELASAIGDGCLAILAQGRRLAPRTIAALKKVSRMAGARLREAKS